MRSHRFGPALQQVFQLARQGMYGKAKDWLHGEVWTETDEPGTHLRLERLQAHLEALEHINGNGTAEWRRGYCHAQLTRLERELGER